MDTVAHLSQRAGIKILKVGPVDAKLFDIPKDFKPVPKN